MIVSDTYVQIYKLITHILCDQNQTVCQCGYRIYAGTVRLKCENIQDTGHMGPLPFKFSFYIFSCNWICNYKDSFSLCVSVITFRNHFTINIYYNDNWFWLQEAICKIVANKAIEYNKWKHVNHCHVGTDGWTADM